MAITVADVEAALAAESEEIPGSYSDRDALLYAVAIGMSKDPLDEKELEYTCESVGNRVVPTAASVLTSPATVNINARTLPLFGSLNHNTCAPQSKAHTTTQTKQPQTKNDTRLFQMHI